MATTLPVKRIDILEGPNLDGLLEGLKFAVLRDEMAHQIAVRFDEVAYFAESGEEYAALGRTFFPSVVGIRYLGNEASSSTRDDFVVTVYMGGMTFEGHYNVHTRKGSLSVIK
jgi:hypothetical protein